ncbi:MAG: hypothetical protein Q7S92_04900 [Candidatus Diapherotrites archaeon]|nr:hypothetical protein [Candidatus Diapherotrites archaeon]
MQRRQVPFRTRRFIVRALRAAKNTPMWKIADHAQVSESLVGKIRAQTHARPTRVRLLRNRRTVLEQKIRAVIAKNGPQTAHGLVKQFRSANPAISYKVVNDILLKLEQEQVQVPPRQRKRELSKRNKNPNTWARRKALIIGLRQGKTFQELARDLRVNIKYLYRDLYDMHAHGLSIPSTVPLTARRQRMIEIDALLDLNPNISAKSLADLYGVKKRTAQSYLNEALRFQKELKKLRKPAKSNYTRAEIEQQNIDLLNLFKEKFTIEEAAFLVGIPVSTARSRSRVIRKK